jgi:hypothetical protein
MQMNLVKKSLYLCIGSLLLMLALQGFELRQLGAV